MSVPQRIIDYAKAVESWLEKQNATPIGPESQPQFLLRIGYSNLYKVDNAIVFSAGMSIDADGSPRAYNPESSKGLDSLANAGRPGDWWGIATNNGRASGDPIIQGESDPAPGFYVSTTSLEDFAFAENRQDRYVDASTVPFVVLPGGMGMGITLGDLCFVYNKANGDSASAIYADTGPCNQIGEGSIALAKALQVPPDARTGGVSAGIIYVVFPGSGKGYQEKTAWSAQADRVFRDWGGMPRLSSILADDLIS
jgi:hypothetical protein